MIDFNNISVDGTVLMKEQTLQNQSYFEVVRNYCLNLDTKLTVVLISMIIVSFALLYFRFYQDSEIRKIIYNNLVILSSMLMIYICTMLLMIIYQ